MNIDSVEKSLPLIKNGLSLISSAGIGRIVGGAVEAVAPQQTRFGKVAVFVGKVGITSAIAGVVDKNNNDTIDTVFAAVKKITQPAKASD